jgi:DMSO/TMAO reductase YedYZ molybdopterin-dependent catalytic subunit
MSASRRVFVQGAVAMIATLVVVFVVGAIIRTVAFPPAVLTAFIVHLTPGGFATAMIERLGHGALKALGVGVAVGVVAAGGVVAVFVWRNATAIVRARRALGAAAGMALAASLLSLAAPEKDWYAVVVYAGVALLFARWVASPVRLSAAFDLEVKPGETPLDTMQRSRRRFIVRSLAALGGVAAGGATVLRIFPSGMAMASVSIASADKPFRMPPDDPTFPKLAGLTPEITRNGDFYNVDINFIKPSVDHRSWKLKVHGLVDSPYELGYRDLQNRFEVVEMAHTLSCISNEVGGDLVSTAVWRGVRLKDVLGKAGLKDGVVDVVFRSAEGYSDSIPLAKALEDTTLVVFGMNGVALPRAHGFPARIIVTGIYGMKNVKWLTEIETVNNDYQGYWEVRGWSDIARMKTSSRIDVPTDGAQVSLPAQLGGIAWAGDRGILRVEISDDGATWHPAVLKRELSPVAWRLWAADVPRGSGERKVLVRATDETGETQTRMETRPHPDGASGWDYAEFTIA